MPRNSGPPTATRLTMERVRLALFVVRHCVGVVIFGWLTVACFQMNAPGLGYLLAVLTPLYLGFAIYSGRTLLRRYRHLAAARRGAEPGVRRAR